MAHVGTVTRQVVVGLEELNALPGTEQQRRQLIVLKALPLISKLNDEALLEHANQIKEARSLLSRVLIPGDRKGLVGD